MRKYPRYSMTSLKCKKNKTVRKREGTIWCASYLHFAERVKIKIMDISSASFPWLAVLKRNHESGTEATLVALNHSSGSRQMHLSLTWPLSFVNPCQVLRDLQDGVTYRSLFPSWIFTESRFLCSICNFCCSSLQSLKPPCHILVFPRQMNLSNETLRAACQEGLEDTCGGNAGHELSVCTRSPTDTPILLQK